MDTTTKSPGTSFNLADEIFPNKEKLGRKTGSKKQEPGSGGGSAKTKAASGTKTRTTDPSGEGKCEAVAEVPQFCTKEQLDAFQLNFQTHMETFVTKLFSEQKRVVSESEQTTTAKRGNTDNQTIVPPKKRRGKEDYELANDGLLPNNKPQDYGLFSDESEDGEVSDEGDDLWEDIALEYAQQNTFGSPITGKLADVISNVFENKLSDDKIKELTEEHKRPENVRMGAPTINPEVWAILTSERRAYDVKLQRIGSRIASANSALCKQLELLYDGRETKNQLDVKAAIKLGMDAIALNCTAMLKLAEHRRSSIRPALNHQFKALCVGQGKEPHELLFGTDLPQRLKDIKDTSKLGSSVAASKKTTYRDSRFLGRRRGGNYRGRFNNPRKQWGNSSYEGQRRNAPAPAQAGYKRKPNFRK